MGGGGYGKGRAGKGRVESEGMEHRNQGKETGMDARRLKGRYKKDRGGSMKATILKAVILTNACKATFSIMGKGCIVA